MFGLLVCQRCRVLMNDMECELDGWQGLWKCGFDAWWSLHSQIQACTGLAGSRPHWACMTLSNFELWCIFLIAPIWVGTHCSVTTLYDCGLKKSLPSSLWVRYSCGLLCWCKFGQVEMVSLVRAREGRYSWNDLSQTFNSTLAMQ